MNGGSVDTSVLEAEMHKLAYNFATEMSLVIQKHLPYILEGIASELRQESDRVYKCKLLEGEYSMNVNNICQNLQVKNSKSKNSSKEV